MRANLTLRRSGKHTRARQFENLESRLNLCVAGFVDGEFQELCLPDPPAAAPAEVTRAADTVNQFANDIYQHFEAEQGNLFLSPLSIATALAMAYAGAAGETASEMEEVLNLGSEPGIHDSFRALLQFRSDNAKPFDLEVANAQWPGLGFPVREEFAQRITNDYGGESQTLDYSDTEAAKDTINEWVEEQTRGTIRDLIKQLSPATVMVLTNTIYFNSYWAIPFAPGATNELPFSRGDGEQVMVPTMYQETAFRYTEQEGYQILELPYHEGETSMVVLLPAEGQASHDLPPNLLTHVNDWLATVPEPQEVDVRLPKFKTTVASSLKTVLGGMGMPSAFGGGADFSAMTTVDGVFIDDVLHKAFVEVNEQGTEAGAATEIGFVVCFAAGTPVRTADGEKPIEEIQVGDQVLARDEHNIEGDNEPKVVEQTFQRTAKIVNLHVGGQVIQTTSEHPFFVRGRGWTTAAKLEPGDLLATSSEWIALEKAIATGEEKTVYNLRVADHHTYFVGGRAWGFALWAHNRCGEVVPQFNANRPFHFVIRDNATTATLFMGRITDPLLEEVPTQLSPQVIDPDPNGSLPGDANRDGEVNFADFLRLSANFQKNNAVWEDGDFNNDAVVSFEDFLILSENFGRKQPIANEGLLPMPAAADVFFSQGTDDDEKATAQVSPDPSEPDIISDLSLFGEPF